MVFINLFNHFLSLLSLSFYIFLFSFLDEFHFLDFNFYISLLQRELHWESLIHRSLNSFSLSFHNFLFFNFYSHFQIPILIIISEISAWRLVFWNSIHMEVASDSFCFLVYSSWLLVFILYVFELFFSFINLYCWKGLHFS